MSGSSKQMGPLPRCRHLWEFGNDKHCGVFGELNANVAQVDPIATFTWVPGLANDTVHWDVHDLDEFGTRDFEAPPRCAVLRVTCDPKPLKSKLLRNGEQ